MHDVAATDDIIPAHEQRCSLVIHKIVVQEKQRFADGHIQKRGVFRRGTDDLHDGIGAAADIDAVLVPETMEQGAFIQVFILQETIASRG